MIISANSLDTDQAQNFVGHDLYLVCSTQMAALKELGFLGEGGE